MREVLGRSCASTEGAVRGPSLTGCGTTLLPGLYTKTVSPAEGLGAGGVREGFERHNDRLRERRRCLSPEVGGAVAATEPVGRPADLPAPARRGDRKALDPPTPSRRASSVVRRVTLGASWGPS